MTIETEGLHAKFYYDIQQVLGWEGNQRGNSRQIMHSVPESQFVLLVIQRTIGAGLEALHGRLGMGRAVKPGRADLYPPARSIGDRDVTVGHSEGLAKEQVALPRVIVIAFDRQFQIFARVRDRCQKMHRADRDQ